MNILQKIFSIDGYMQTMMTYGGLSVPNVRGRARPLNLGIHLVGFHVQIAEREFHG